VTEIKEYCETTKHITKLNTIKTDNKTNDEVEKIKLKTKL